MAENYKEKILEKYLLILIVLIGVFLRLFNLGQYPHLYNQEALVGWRAESILLTGKDELGRSFPIIFSSMSGYEFPLQTYLIIPFIRFFGLNEFAVRLPLVLVGIISIFCFYRLLKHYFKGNNNVQKWGLLIYVISPGLVFMSRATYSVGMFFYLFIIGFYFLIRDKSKISFSISLLMFLGSIYCSITAIIFIIPFLAFSGIYFKNSKWLYACLLLIFFSIPLYFNYFKSPGVSLDLQNNKFNIFSDVTLTNSINTLRGEDISNGFGLISKIFYNKAFFLMRLSENFLKHFNPRLFFSSGDGNFHNGLINFGPLLLIFIIPFLRGLKGLYRDYHSLFRYFLGWMVIAVIPAIFTYPFPDLSKSIFVLFPIILITTYGLNNLKRKILIVFVFLFAINISIVLYDAISKEPYRDLEKRTYSYKDLSREINLLRDKYAKIFITNAYGSDPGPSLLFYLNVSPAVYFRNETKSLIYRNYINQFENICIDQKEKWVLDKKNLYIIIPSELETNQLFYGIDYKIINRIFDPTGREIYNFLEYVPKKNVK